MKIKKNIINLIMLGIVLTLILPTIAISQIQYSNDIITINQSNNINSNRNNYFILNQPSEITFYQIDYDWTKTTYLNSNTGQIEVNIEELVAATGLRSGYINVYTSEGWVIQNLEIIEDFPYETLGTYFDLGQSGNVDSIGAYIIYDELPYTSFEYSGPLPMHPVYETTLSAEGGEDFIVTIRPQPPSTSHLPGYSGFDDVGANTHCVQKEHPNIQSAHMQCVPIAYANNLQYLEDWYGVYVPHDNVIGVNGSPSNSLVGVLDVKMLRPSISRYNGSGTGYSDSIRGLVEYAYFESLQIDIRHQGLEGDKDFEFEDSGYISYGQGNDITFDFIYNEVCQGSAVELAMGYFNATGRTGGHMVMVVAAGYVYGVPYIYFLDDRVQVSEKNPLGDNQGTNGPPQRRWLIDVDNDGLYNLVEDPESFNFPPEVEAIYVQQAKNQPPLKPSIPVGGDFIMKPDVIYGFTSTTTDPNGHPIWYWFDWGDGTNSGWVGPYESGEEGGALHSWSQLGLYEIRAKAKDFNDAESEWSDIRIGVIPNNIINTLDIGILPLNPPRLDDRNFGPIGTPGLKITITNIGDSIERDIDWTFSANGGQLFWGEEVTGNIARLNVSEFVEFIITPFPNPMSVGLSPLGFGMINMIVTVDSSTSDLQRTQENAFLLGPFILRGDFLKYNLENK